MASKRKQDPFKCWVHEKALKVGPKILGLDPNACIHDAQKTPPKGFVLAEPPEWAPPGAVAALKAEKAHRAKLALKTKRG